ncbi:MAG TPA: glycosyltransferase family 87 protein [Geobacteraceae bacterium]|nr:glycosyltransferase family 87 protein [Geobacteraceae bacterium]
MSFRLNTFKPLNYEQQRMRVLIVVHAIVWLLLTVLVGKHILVDEHRTASPFGITIQSAGPGSPYYRTTIVDLASIINFVNKTWLGQTSVKSGASVYSVDNHLKVTSEWAGKKVRNALPFGYSPTIFWILVPFIIFPNYLAFYLFDLMGLISIWWITHPSRCRFGLGLLAFLSPLAQACFDLGQTALMTGVGLLFIAEKTKYENSVAGWRSSFLEGLALWALTAKPPLALVACSALVSLRKWRSLLVGGVLAVILTLVVSPLLGPNWVHDYMHLLSFYDRINSGSIFAWSLVPSHMANLRAVLSVDLSLSDDIATRISAVLWLIAIMCIALTGIRSKLSEGGIWALSLMSYLIFCPHVTSTEELQLVLLIPLCIPTQNSLRWQELLILIVVTLLPFVSPAIGPLAGNRLILFFAKILLFIFVIAYMTTKRAKVEIAH